MLKESKKQTLQDFEVLFVNDGSTDGSLKIIEVFSKRNSNPFEVFNKQNGGQSSARNLAFPYIQGAYTMVLDRDDYIDEKYLEILHANAKENIMIW